MNFRAEVPGYIDLFELHKLDPKTYPFLLQSVAGHAISGRYDLLFAFPKSALTSAQTPDFFGDLSRQFKDEAGALATDLPFIGGWFLLLGYEAARGVEPGLHFPDSPFRLPDALAVRCTAAVIHDRHLGTTHLLAENDPRELEKLRADLELVNKSKFQTIDNNIIYEFAEDAPQDFMSGVKAIHEYLRAGDTFQVNLSRAWRAQLLPDASYVDVYARLRHNNPAPFAGLACWDQSVVVSSSPERLVQIEGGKVQTRPIAGTRPRGTDPAEDRALRDTLIGNLKERAEHVMLIDLERNDLGRVCRPGSVEVSELMAIESYAHVHHIVSNVRGILRPDIGPGEVLKAVFPGGTITGCPKIRAMQIIAELERVGRGPYTGAMGYLSRCGRLDTNILIRSLVCEDRQLTFRAGAGIVHDSDPAEELQETRAKARGLLLALGAEA